MTRYNLLFLFAISFVSTNAQPPGNVIPSNVRATNTIERLTDSNGLGTNEMMYGIPLPEGKVIGDTYLSTQWKRSVILLYENNKLLEGYPVRYDINADELDVRGVNGVKVLAGKKVKSFVWIDSARKEPYYFVNAKDYKEDGVPLIGFFEVLVDGTSPLFKKINITVKKADYNVTLSVGSRDDKILKNPAYYLAEDNKVYEIPASKKKFLPLLKRNASQVEAYMESNGLSPKKEEDLLLIFKYYNSLNNN
jgi:hypothetical protein